MIQIYGRFDGWWSHAQVSRGIVAGLIQNGIDVQVWNVEPSQPCQGFGDWKGVDPLVGRDTTLPGFYIGGYPPFCAPWINEHPWRGALFISESSTIPTSWDFIAADLDMVCVPSRWCRDAYSARKNVLVVPHGLHPAFSEPIPLPRVGTNPIKYLHIAGAASFLDRKGTPQLIKAFSHVFRSGQAKLTIRSPETPELLSLLEAVPEGLVELQGEWDALEPEKMRELIAEHDVVVQPSRAEAFGMIPMEARTVGRPVVLTPASGHLDHFEPEVDICVTPGDEGPIKVNGIPNGFAPSVESLDISKALDLAHAAVYSEWEPIRGGYFWHHTWQKATEGLARELP